MVLHLSLSVSSAVSSAAIAGSAPAVFMVSFSASIASASTPVLSAFTRVHQSCPNSSIVNSQSSAPEPVASNTPPRGPVVALLRKLLTHRDAKFAELDKTFIAREDRVLELESSLARSSSGETTLLSQVGALWIDPDAVGVDLTASQLSVAIAISVLDQFCADNRRLTSQVSDLNYTADSLCLQLSNLQPSIFSAALDSLRSAPNIYLRLLRSLAGLVDRLDSDFTTLVMQAQESCSTLRRGKSLLLDEFRAPGDEDEVPEKASVPLETDQFPVVFRKQRHCCHSVRHRPSEFVFVGPCFFVQSFHLHFADRARRIALLPEDTSPPLSFVKLVLSC